MIESLTGFADQAVILPVLALAAAGLLVTGWPRAALAWVIVVPGVLFVVLVGKIMTIDCAGPLTQSLGLYSPSGHTASSAVVYGGLVALLVRTRWPERVALISATVVAVVIGASRLALRVHSVADVLVGAPVGILGAYALIRLAGPPPLQLRFRPFIAAALLMCMLLLHGSHLKAEEQIGKMAWDLDVFGICRQ
jgi:membrane-associated phospholipid phosphatase